MAGGLGGKVVWIPVDDHSAPDDIRNGEAVCENSEIGIPPAAKEGRQIPRMIGVLTAVRIEMSPGVLEVRWSTGAALVDVEAKDGVGTGNAVIGKSMDLGGDQCAKLLREKRDHSGDGRARCTGDVGNGGGSLGRALHDQHLKWNRFPGRGK